ncbi:MAG: hypothetical protein M1834_000812 [Cirrosporium novae-zelandiae]|nr:MAG: hypothetical protein M1834_000812 [Cirrosporium novae-zelandiae]
MATIVPVQENFHLLSTILFDDASPEPLTDSGITSFSSDTRQGSFILAPIGTFALGLCHFPSCALDCLCIGTSSQGTFFQLAGERLQLAGEGKEKRVRILRADKDATVMLGVDVQGREFRIQYLCSEISRRSNWITLRSLPLTDPLFNRGTLFARRKLNRYLDAVYLLETLPQQETFRSAFSNLRRWAIDHGIFSSTFGYLTDDVLVLMLSHVFKKCIEAGDECNESTFSPSELTSKFFSYYPKFPWKTEPIVDPSIIPPTNLHPTNLTVLSIRAPSLNLAASIPFSCSEAIFSSIQAEAEAKANADPNPPASPSSSTPLSTFLGSYSSYIQIHTQYFGTHSNSNPDFARFVDIAERTCAVFVQSIDGRKSNDDGIPVLKPRIWPAMLCEKQNSSSSNDNDDNNDNDGSNDEENTFFLVGCGYAIPQEHSNDKQKQNQKHKHKTSTINQALSNLLTSALETATATATATPTTTTTASTTHISLSLIPNSQLNSHTTTITPTRPLPPPTSLPPLPPTTFLPPSTPTPTLTPPSKPALLPPTTPIHQILSRLHHDPLYTHNPSTGIPYAYYIGYEDRFEDRVLEIPMAEWKGVGMFEEEGWIPLHRVRWVRREDGGEEGDWVWVRGGKGEGRGGGGCG